jgi:integrase/recombinase XerD
MSNNTPSQSNSDDARNAYAEAFNESADPLAQYSTQFYELPDPFEYYIETVLYNKTNITSESTINEYRRTYRQWRNHMESTDRHPACPSPKHVSGFIAWRRDEHENSRRSIKSKLSRLIGAYEHWQSESVFPHPSDFNPFALARERTDLGSNSHKPFPDPSLPQLQSDFAEIQDVRSRSVIGTQIKEGIRRGEVCNLQLQDIHISHKELQEAYPELGTHPALEGREDAMYIPHDREGNKSSNPRLLPIDEELRWLLVQYLATRPQVDEPWVFLSETSYSQLGKKDVNEIWKDAFHPKYAETDETRGLTSHFGRHWFSSHWRLEIGLERELIQYMRGDRVEPINEFPDAIDDYLHPNFDHVEQMYRNNIFKLDLSMRHFISG